MPARGRLNSPGQDKIVKNERTSGLKNIQDFLTEKGVKSEKVLDFICFEYKKKHYRVRNVAEAKVALGLINY